MPSKHGTTQTQRPDPRSERETLGLNFGPKGVQHLPKQRAQFEEEMERDFRITASVLGEYGFTMECKGCEAKLTLSVSSHTPLRAEHA